MGLGADAPYTFLGDREFEEHSLIAGHGTKFPISISAFTTS